MPAVLSAPDTRLREWTTAQARPRERLDYWVGAICEAFLEMDCSSTAADRFDGLLVHLPLQRLAVNRVQASTQDVYRTPAAIAKSKDQPFYLITQIEQPWLVKQGGHVLQLRPGDTVLVEAAQAYELHFPHSVTCLSVQMPRAWVGQWLQTVDLSHARVAHREQGWGAMLSALSLQLGPRPEWRLRWRPTGSRPSSAPSSRPRWSRWHIATQPAPMTCEGKNLFNLRCRRIKFFSLSYITL